MLGSNSEGISHRAHPDTLDLHVACEGVTRVIPSYAPKPLQNAHWCTTAKLLVGATAPGASR